MDQIRGKSYEEALMVLEYTPYRACEPLIKLLVSVRHFKDLTPVCMSVVANCKLDVLTQAGANAKENLDLRKVNLYVKECYCNEGPILKRIKTRAKGR